MPSHAQVQYGEEKTFSILYSDTCTNIYTFLGQAHFPKMFTTLYFFYISVFYRSVLTYYIWHLVIIWSYKTQKHAEFWRIFFACSLTCRINDKGNYCYLQKKGLIKLYLLYIYMTVYCLASKGQYTLKFLWHIVEHFHLCFPKKPHNFLLQLDFKRYKWGSCSIFTRDLAFLMSQ